jgi:hypothetical protein
LVGRCGVSQSRGGEGGRVVVGESMVKGRGLVGGCGVSRSVTRGEGWWVVVECVSQSVVDGGEVLRGRGVAGGRGVSECSRGGSLSCCGVDQSVGDERERDGGSSWSESMPQGRGLVGVRWSKSALAGGLMGRRGASQPVGDERETAGGGCRVGQSVLRGMGLVGHRRVSCSVMRGEGRWVFTGESRWVMRGRGLMGGRGVSQC